MILWFTKNMNDGTISHFHCTENDSLGIETHLNLGYELFGFISSTPKAKDPWVLSNEVWNFWFGEEIEEYESTQMVHD